MYIFEANVEILIINILTLTLLFAFNIRYWKPQLLNALSMIYIMAVLGSFFEIFAFYADGKPELIWLNYLSNILYLGSIGFIGFSMLEYCSSQFPQSIWSNSFQHKLFVLPLFVELIFLLTTPVTKLVFYIDADGFYHRANTFFIQMIPYGYLICTTIMGIYWYSRTETVKERSTYLALALFSIPPFALGGIQLMIKANSLDILESSIMISLLANYAVSQNNRITRDTLTRLPNREVLDAIIIDSLKDIRKGEKHQLYVLMGDLDNFKKINDTYGHLEGDRALILAADALYNVCKKYKATAARYAGDEFTVVLETEDEKLPEILIHEIDEALAEAGKNEQFVLSMSIGYAASRPSDTVTDILKAADRELYNVKKIRKTGR